MGALQLFNNSTKALMWTTHDPPPNRQLRQRRLAVPSSKTESDIRGGGPVYSDTWLSSCLADWCRLRSSAAPSGRADTSLARFTARNLNLFQCSPSPSYSLSALASPQGHVTFSSLNLTQIITVGAQDPTCVVGRLTAFARIYKI
jgi:hypothetical protein